MTHPPKYPRTPHCHWSLGVSSDDRLIDPAAYRELESKPLVVTEKLDGSNVCLFNGEVYSRSTSLPSHNGWHAMARKNHAWKTYGDSRYAYYGEDIYGRHSIDYVIAGEENTFNLFAVRDLDRDVFLSWEAVEEIAQEKNLKTVSAYYVPEGCVRSELASFMDRIMESIVDLQDRECEGLVVRNREEFKADDFALNVYKWVRAGHVQTDQHWTKNWQPNPIVRDK